MLSSHVLRISLLSPASLAVLASVQAQELVVNGGFETSRFAPAWTQFGDPGSTGPVSFGVYEGSYAAALGPETPGGIAQILDTVPGTAYEIRFALEKSVPIPDNSFEASFGGQSLLSLTNSPNEAYTLYTFTKTATSGATPLTFTFRNPSGYFFLDAVSVRPAAPVPEPATLAALGLGAAAMLRRKRRR